MNYKQGNIECWYGGPLADKEMLERGTQDLVENAGTRAKGPGSWREWIAAQHRQQTVDQQWLFQLLAEQQRILLDQMASSQVQMNAQLWEQVTKSMAQVGACTQSGEGGQRSNLAIKVQKMTAYDDLEVYFNAFK